MFLVITKRLGGVAGREHTVQRCNVQLAIDEQAPRRVADQPGSVPLAVMRACLPPR